jgi:hypothetical protein
MPPVNDSALTDLPTLKQWLNIGAADTGADDPLARLILSASGTIKKAINRDPFLSSTVTETYIGNGSRRLFLNTQPVTAVISITESGNVLSPSGDLYQNSGYTFDAYSVWGLRWALSGTYEITYTGGFSPISTEAYMAEQAVLALANLWWRRRAHASEISRSLGGQITARYVEDELPPEARSIIKHLRRVK